MTKTELKEARERHLLLCKHIKDGTAFSLFEEKPEQQAKRIERLLKPNNYDDFFQYYFGGNGNMALADSPCSSFHIQATKQLLKHHIITQFRIWFRGSAKSVHSNIGNMFLLKQSKESQFSLLIGANEQRSKMLLSDFQAHLKFNDRIIKDFGQQISYGNWEQGSFETKDNCYFLALGIEQPFRGLRNFGNRIHYAVVDDIEDRKVANNSRIVRERTDKILGDLGFAMSKDKRRLVVCNNLITNHGVIKRLLDKIGDKKNTRKSIVNIIDKKGKPTWAEHLTKSYIQDLRDNTDYYTWMREMMNSPIEEGKVFKNEWVQFGKIPSLSQMDGLVVYCDLSYKESGDYKAIVLVGKKKRDFYIIDAYCQQSTRDQTAKWLYDTYEKRHLEDFSVQYYIEGSFAQDEFVADFDLEGDIRRFYIPLVADEKKKAGKYERIESMVGWFERGNVTFNQSQEKNIHFKNLLHQLLAFEKGSNAHDDGPDALQSAIAELNKVGVEKTENIITSPFYQNKPQSNW